MKVQSVSISPSSSCGAKNHSKTQKSNVDTLSSGMLNLAITSPSSPPVIPYYQEFRGDYDGRWRPDKEGYQLTPPNHSKTHNIQDVGDSDDEPSDKESVGNARVNKPIKAAHTTVYSQKKRIKGDELITLCQEWVQAAIGASIQSKGAIKIQGNRYWIRSTDDWLRSAGYLVCSPSKDMVAGGILFDSLQVGLSKVALTLKKEGTTERLYFPKELLDQLADPHSPFSRYDLSCDEITTVTRRRIDLLKTTDQQYAAWQLERLKGNPGPTAALDRKWLDCINAWMFGVEASRNNATFVTGVMTLELIAEGHLTYKKAFSENKYGGRFPMATLQSGTGNMAARRKLIEHAANGRSAGMAEKGARLLSNTVVPGYLDKRHENLIFLTHPI